MDTKDSDVPEQNGEVKRVGCAHYKRRAKFVTPCCNKFYMCRYCHDENEDHHFNRKSCTELICTECDTRQKIQAECENCGVRFGKYTCLICNLFDDEDKRQYHCDGCGICRVGGRERFFHCERCNMCLPLHLQINGHRCVPLGDRNAQNAQCIVPLGDRGRCGCDQNVIDAVIVHDCDDPRIECVENVSRCNCPVCLEDIHTSRIRCHIPDCGHLLHRTCFVQLLSSGHYTCPTCQTSMIDMSKLWEYLDSEVAMTPMPPEYSDYKATILCKDCHMISTVKVHMVGLKCLHCGGYNTCQTKGVHKDTSSSATANSSSTSTATGDSTQQPNSADSVATSSRHNGDHTDKKDSTASTGNNDASSHDLDNSSPLPQANRMDQPPQA